MDAMIDVVALELHEREFQRVEADKGSLGHTNTASARDADTTAGAGVSRGARTWSSVAGKGRGGLDDAGPYS